MWCPTLAAHIHSCDRITMWQVYISHKNWRYLLIISSALVINAFHCTVLLLNEIWRRLMSQNVNWVTDFLCNRKQCVVLNGEKSSCFSVLSGIPQGSILGPLLFLIYINDLPEICAGEDPSSEIFLYADDSKIYKVIRNQSDQQKLQTILNMIKHWSDEWLLRLNIDKCKSVSYV